MAFFDGLIRFLGGFDSHGLRHSTDHLKRVWPSITQCDPEVQAMYADRVTVENIRNHEFLNDQFTNIDSAVMDRANAITIGNLAYVYLHSPWIEFRHVAVKYLMEFRREYRQNYSG